ncbi:fatty acid-binding protein, liver [Anoplophora glabripennis]|uniref:fatty acid-binding protein, liver n=1 Tax=Anoplophora glabripennis TaxID=217634 RepID=UPI0008748A3C|nr:fatty acid-binding protein, liver [Anoplophora glabripennis]
MVQITGKYKLAENKNFLEFLLAVGMPEEKAKEENKITGTFDVKIEGKKVSMENDTPPYVSNLVLDEEVDEKLENEELKSTTTLSGNVITVTSNTKNGEPAVTRTYSFSDSGLETTITAYRDGKTISAQRIYKRV